MDVLFHFSAIIVLPFWVGMICFPRSIMTARLVRSPWIALPAAFCYLAFLLPHLPELLPFFASPSSQSMAVVMGKPWAASMFWTYAGAFDLFVGRWMYFDSRECGMSSWLVSPILLVSIFFGPLGFVLYATLKLVRFLRFAP